MTVHRARELAEGDGICDCCGRYKPLPYHHDSRTWENVSWDYCQDCYDAGCDLVSCEVRSD